MIGLEQRRRSFLLGLASMGISQLSARGMTPARGAAPEGYVLGATEGEQLIHFRDHGKIFIKVGSATGSDNLALGTQQVTVGAGIPIHRHLQMDEAFYVLEGSGIFILNDVRHRLKRTERYSFPRTLGMGLRIPIANCSYFGSCRLLAWTAFSVKPVIRPAYRQSSSLESRSMKLPANMGRNSDTRASQ